MGFLFLRLLTLVSAILLTLRVQAYWLTDDAFAMFFPVILWFALSVDWTMRQIHHWKQKGQLEPRAWLLPLCFIFVVASGVVHAPLRVLFWMQKADLEAAEKRPPGQQKFNSEFHPFQVAKDKGATRLLMWENRALTSKTAFGFAYCPNDEGCKGAPFYNYWDYGNGAPVYVSVGYDWYATKVSAEDVGD